jgi:hypothetical protein
MLVATFPCPLNDTRRFNAVGLDEAQERDDRSWYEVDWAGAHLLVCAVGLGAQYNKVATLHSVAKSCKARARRLHKGDAAGTRLQFVTESHGLVGVHPLCAAHMLRLTRMRCRGTADYLLTLVAFSARSGRSVERQRLHLLAPERAVLFLPATPAI